NYEAYRNKQQSSALRTVLTDSARQGNFSYKDSSGATQTVNLLKLRNVSIDPTMKAIIDQLPAANAKGAGDGLNTSGYRFNYQANEFRDQLVYKMDYYLTAKNSISGTYNYINDPTQRGDAISTFYTTIPPLKNTIKDHLLSLSWRWMASPTLTNEVRGGFLRSNTAFLDDNAYPKFLVGG